MKLLHKLTQTQTLVSLPPSATVRAAADLMAQKLVGSVLVMEQGQFAQDKLVGIFTERDLLNRVVAKGIDPSKVALSQVMTPKVVTVQIDDSLEDCYDQMQQTKSRHVPIVDGDKVVGMVTMRNILEWLWKEIDAENAELKRYISS